MNKISKAGLGMYITLISFILSSVFGLDQNEATEAITNLFIGIGSILWIVGQITRKDLDFGLLRKDED